MAEAVRATAPTLSATERELLELTFATHELGVVPEEYATVLRSLGTRHELRLLSNIWAPKTRWIEHLSQTGVLSLFSTVTFFSDTTSVKPSRCLTEMSLAGVACSRRQVLMIGDSLERDMRAGRAVGASTLWLSERSIPSGLESLVDFQLASLLDLDRSPSCTAI